MKKKNFFEGSWSTYDGLNGSLTSSSQWPYLLATDKNDRFLGSDGADRLWGGKGNDLIHGGSGNDKIWGDEGNDTLRGGGGDDVVQGGSGDDRVYGNDGNDIVVGGWDNDFVYGGDGKDRVYGGHGNDRVGGGKGDDKVMGGTGNDTVIGGLGDDVLWGCGYHYYDATGAGGQEWYVGDWLYLNGRGDDVFVFQNREGEGNDVIKDWGDGDNDRIEIKGTTYSELNIYQDGAHTVIKYGEDNSITLENTLATSIDETDFIF